MNSLIFRTACRFLLPLLILFSVVILLRGHNTPGGGFVGGLLAASAFALNSMAFGARPTRALLRVDLVALVGTGLTLAVLSGVPGLIAEGAFLKGLWMEFGVPGFEEPIKIGTPLLFDVGVYLTVLGTALTMILTLEEA